MEAGDSSAEWEETCNNNFTFGGPKALPVAACRRSFGVCSKALCDLENMSRKNSEALILPYYEGFIFYFIFWKAKQNNTRTF